MSSKTKLIVLSVACGFAAIWIYNNVGPVTRALSTRASGPVVA